MYLSSFNNLTIDLYVKKIILNLVFGSLCLIGFLVHSVQISNNYFEYQTTTNLELDIPQNVAIPALSICWRYADLLDIQALQKLNPEFTAINFSSDETIVASIRKIQSIIKVEQIFNFTPSSSKIMDECVVRTPDNYDVTHLKAVDCQSMFNIKKFYVQEYICYRTKMKANGSYVFQKVGSYLEYPGMAYQISYQIGLFGNNQVVTPIVHGTYRFPTTSIYFGPELRRFDILESHKKRNNYFYLSFFQIEHNRLPAPYATKCVNYEVDRADCEKQCLIEKILSNYGRLPFTKLIVENETFPLDRVAFHDGDFQNQTFKLELDKLDHDCNEKCIELDCYFQLFVTQTEYIGKRSENIAFRVNLPSNPNYYITYLPMMLFYEYVTYGLSSLGVWFGISIFSLNPLPFCARYFNRRRQVSPENRLFSRNQMQSMKCELDAVKTQLTQVWEHLQRISEQS